MDLPCEPNPCLEPSVACCFANGMCQFLTAAQCTAAGGTPDEYGSDCTPNDYPPCYGDPNCDGNINFGDINPFVALITQCANDCPCPGPVACP
jgi:hypothetical protein